MKTKIGGGSVGNVPVKGAIVEFDSQDIAKAGAAFAKFIGFVLAIGVLLLIAIVTLIREIWPLLVSVAFLAGIIYLLVWLQSFRKEMALVSSQLALLETARARRERLLKKEGLLHGSADPSERSALQKILEKAWGDESDAAARLSATLISDLQAVESRLSKLVSLYVEREDYERLASPHRYALKQIRDTLARTRPGFEADNGRRDSLKQRYPPAEFFGADFARELRLRAYYPRTEESHLNNE